MKRQASSREAQEEKEAKTENLKKRKEIPSKTRMEQQVS